MWPRSARRVRVKLSEMVAAAVPSHSTKVARAAPRDNASMPPAPDPAKRSSTLAPGKDGSRIANRVCLTRSPRGRVTGPGAARRVPRAVPAITRPAESLIGLASGVGGDVGSRFVGQGFVGAANIGQGHVREHLVGPDSRQPALK